MIDISNWTMEQCKEEIEKRESDIRELISRIHDIEVERKIGKMPKRKFKVIGNHWTEGRVGEYVNSSTEQGNTVIQLKIVDKNGMPYYNIYLESDLEEVKENA